MLSTAKYVMRRRKPRGLIRRLGTACTRRILGEGGEETNNGRKKQADGQGKKRWTEKK
jgi:hypothetical protein